MSRRPKKRCRACGPNIPDPLVDPGNPPHRHQARTTAHPARQRHRMVALAARPPSRSAARTPQKESATVMLRNYSAASGRMRIRPGSITVKCLVQSVRSPILAARTAPPSAAAGIGERNSTTPDDAGNPTCQASSPKSLSKVRSTRVYRSAHANISSSLLPGATARTQTMPCPAALSTATASPGKFSLARKRISRSARINLLRSQHIASVGKASSKVVMREPRIIG